MTREEAIKWLKIKRECYDYEGMSCEKPMGAGLEIGCGYCEEAIDMAIEALHREEAEEKGYCHRIRPRNVEVVGDLISRADAIEAVMAEGRKVYTSEYANAERIIYEADAVETLSMLPSAEAELKVIRSKTLMPTKDFKEWAKRIREVNPNAIVIPCDAEVVSAEAVQADDRIEPNKIYCSPLIAENVEVVVRCKNCKWYGQIGCAIWIVEDSDKPKANDYCSFGERREP